MIIRLKVIDYRKFHVIEEILVYKGIDDIRNVYKTVDSIICTSILYLTSTKLETSNICVKIIPIISNFLTVIILTSVY